MSPSTSSGHRVRRPLAAVLSLAAASALGACGETGTAPLPRETAANGTVFTKADAVFAGDLLVQRAREFALIDLTVGRPLDADLATFLDGARTTRASEIDQVTTWLTDWGRQVPPTIRDHAAAHEGRHHFTAVEKAVDAEFARTWIAAYRTELGRSDDIAAAERKGGLVGDAKALAAAVEDANERESAQLAQLSD